MKRNNKGETQLHTACIAGNITVVQHLIEQGHLINVRDNCGWLPIHESCINGHLEIVRLLINKGALINDRGGTLCNGITPLYDAASNGHLQVIELLLENGASPIAKSDDGETALLVLKKWRNTVELTPNEQNLYDKLIQRMQDALNKCGHQDKENDQGNPMQQSRLSGRRQIGDMRRNIVESDDSEDDVTLVETFESSPTDEYKKVMANLRHRTHDESACKKRKVNERKSALVSSSFNDDNWLEDDLGVNATKKRKTSATPDLLTTNAIRRTSSSKSLTRSVTSNEGIPEHYFDDIDFDETVTSDSFSNSATPSKAKRKIQTSLLRAGFECNKTAPQQCKTTKFTQAEADSTSEVQLNRTIATSLLPIDVRIENRLYRVPVPLSEINTLSIKWLAEEAAKRYCRCFYYLILNEIAL